MNFRFLRSPFRWRPVFDLTELRVAYQTVFRHSQPGTVIARDLAEFTGAGEPLPEVGDLYRLGRIAGRRDCWLRLMEFCEFTDEQLYRLLKGETVLSQEDYHA